MSEAGPTTASEPTTRGRGRGSGSGRGRGNRGGYGKYLRARGRGRGGRPAEFGKRLLLEGEGGDEEELDEEEAAQQRTKYSRRQLASNVDRYKEQEPELGSDGEPQIEPEVDVSGLLEKQRLSEKSTWAEKPAIEDDKDEVDMSLAHIGSRKNAPGSNKKGKVEQIEWDDELEELNREKVSAEATRELKSRLRAKIPRLSAKPVTGHSRKEQPLAEAPPLPLPDGSLPVAKGSKQEMEEFLDDLLG